MSVLEKLTSADAIALEDKYGAHNYHPLPVVLSRGEGVYVWDVEGKKYYDFLSAYSAVNQGHCHPKIVGAMINQAQTLTLTSRAFYNDKLGVYEEFITNYFGFDKVLPMNTGAEAVETALKISRKWAYEKKGIQENQAQIIVCEGNFHGRTTTIISFSNDENARKNFGPYTEGFIRIPYNDIDALEKALQSSSNIAGFLVEPIQGEAGVYTPAEDYLAKAKALCKANNVLFIADEVQSGAGRTGKFLAIEHSGVIPDIVTMAKSIGSGMPISATTGKAEIMDAPHLGGVGGTYSGSPLAVVAAHETVKQINTPEFLDKATHVGNIIVSRLTAMSEKFPVIGDIRGLGAMLVVEFVKDRKTKEPDMDFAMAVIKKSVANGVILIRAGLYTNCIRFLPPIIISDEQLNEGLDVIENAIQEVINERA